MLMSSTGSMKKKCLTSLPLPDPGAIAVNGAIVVGFKLAGIKGAIVSILATILPPVLVLH
ncbi:MAG: chromate transporter [Thomasclavelia ramosa]